MSMVKQEGGHVVKGLYVTRKKAQKGQVKVRFEVIPFKFVTGKYC